MRRRISSDIRWSRFLFIAIGAWLLFDFTSSLTGNSIDQKKVIVELVLIFVCGGLYFLFDRAKTVEFDNEFMYVTDRTGEEKIPFKDIYKIKLTMTEINNRNMWKIGYYDRTGTATAVRILPRLSYQDFDEFKDQVMAANEDVKIKNWSHSFDFDQ